MTDRDELEIMLEDLLDGMLERLLPRLVAEVALLRPPLPPTRAERLVDVHVLAAYLSVSPQFVRQNGTMLRGRKLGRTWRFSLTEADQVLLQKAVDRG